MHRLTAPPAGSHLSEAVQTPIRSSSFRVGSLHDLFQTSRQTQGALYEKTRLQRCLCDPQ